MKKVILDKNYPDYSRFGYFDLEEVFTITQLIKGD